MDYHWVYLKPALVCLIICFLRSAGAKANQPIECQFIWLLYRSKPHNIMNVLAFAFIAQKIINQSRVKPIKPKIPWHSPFIRLASLVWCILYTSNGEMKPHSGVVYRTQSLCRCVKTRDLHEPKAQMYFGRRGPRPPPQPEKNIWRWNIFKIKIVII